MIFFQRNKKPLEAYFENGFDEAFHLMMDIANDRVQRWAVFNNLTLELQSGEGEGTTVDEEEPFVIKYGFCLFVQNSDLSFQS